MQYLTNVSLLQDECHFAASNVADAPIRELFGSVTTTQMGGHKVRFTKVSVSTLKAVNISKTVRATEQCTGMTLIEVDICHRMETMRILLSMSSIFIFKVKLFLVKHLL